MRELFKHLPAEAVQLIGTGVSAEFATVSAAGVPIDTPTFFFPSPDLTTLDIGTGIAYPAKADRARRDPRVGMLIEGSADQPVLSIAGHAAVRDADLQTNLDRYLAETIFAPNVDPKVVPWEETRKRLTYLTRIIVCVTPVHVRWWTNRAAMEDAPREWRRPAGMPLPSSDPAPAGKPSEVPAWPQKPWQELAEDALAQGFPAHLTLLDKDGYPLPIRVRAYERHDLGFRLDVPAGTPWSVGKATLSFVGKEIFVGELTRETILRVERALPVLPMMSDRTGTKADVLEALTKRLNSEVKRRGQTLPVVPEHPPEPTEGAKLRAAAAQAMDAGSVGGGISR